MAEHKIDLRNAGEETALAFYAKASIITGLPVATCETLFKAGWRLESRLNEPSKWVQTIPNVR